MGTRAGMHSDCWVSRQSSSLLLLLLLLEAHLHQLELVLAGFGCKVWIQSSSGCLGRGGWEIVKLVV